MRALDEWQRQLASHFEDVTLTKLDQPHEPVTFALEHGLDQGERNALVDSIRASVAARSLCLKHYVCWAVYAAEVGYHYAGDQYWHTFTAQTPGWDQGDRHFVKACFKRFSEQYNGAIPRGAWARKFSIICWPITHAILPTDLQRQLAEVLYRVRHTVVVDDVASPRQLGQIIAANSAGTTSRFAQLAGEPELIGQIASALLRDDRSGEWIEPETLARITADLNVEEQARSWLGDAKHQVSRRAQVKGLKSGRTAQRSELAADSRAPKPKIRPTLLLGPYQDNHWRLVIEAPNLTPLVRHYSDLQPILERATVRLGRHERRYPGRALLHSSLAVAQTQWPTPQLPLITIEPTLRDLDALFAHEASMPAGPWLFRLNQDGIGCEIRSRRVSTGAEYIIVNRADEYSAIGDRVDVGCDDVIAWRFIVSSLDEIDGILREWQLVPSRQVIAQPCGLPPSRWDREGSAEWLSTDRPIVHLTANYGISHFDATIDIGNRVLATSAEASDDNSACVILPSLPAGTYVLHVRAQPSDASVEVEEGDMEISIRDVSLNNGTGVAMLVAQEPAEATLNDLFEGKVDIHVLGPASRRVSVSLRLSARERAKPLIDKDIASLPLPLTNDVFSRQFDALIGKDEALSRAYIEADRCELTFDGVDLGRRTCRYERPFTPLRWGLSQRRGEYVVTLYEDVDNPNELETLRYDFATPLRSRPLGTAELARASRNVALPGLYVARTNSSFASCIVPVRSFEALKAISPRFYRPERTVEFVEHYLDTIALWRQVEIGGNLFGRYAWRAAVRALVQQLVGLISGTPWYKAERAYQYGDDLVTLSHRIPYKHYGKGWAATLNHSIADLCQLSTAERVAQFASLTARPLELCDFALRLASDPVSVHWKTNPSFGRKIQAVMRRSELVRAARFVVLGTAATVEALEDPGRAIHGGWIWN